MKRLLVFFTLMSGLAFSQNTDLLEKAKQGDASAQYQLASIYQRTNKIDEAIKWYKMSADNGISGSQFYLGKIYLNGEGGIDKNIAEGIKYLKLAAEQGAISAQYELAIIYIEGKVVPQDINEGIKWVSGMGCSAGIRAICIKFGELKANSK